MDREGYNGYLRRHAEVSPVLRAHYGALIFRKLRLSEYIRHQIADGRLVQDLKNFFGPDHIYVIGNWSAPNTKFQQPIKGIGLKRKLRSLGLKVLLIDEYGTSSFCPDCEGRVEKFKEINNPRPSADRPRIISHKILRCKSQSCQDRCLARMKDPRPGTEPTYRFSDRDLLATLNMRHILQSLRNNGATPQRFQRRH